MGPIRGRQDPGGPHIGPMNFAFWALQQWDDRPANNKTCKTGWCWPSSYSPAQVGWWLQHNNLCYHHFTELTRYQQVDKYINKKIYTKETECLKLTQIAMFTWPTWAHLGPPGSCRSQVGLVIWVAAGYICHFPVYRLSPKLSTVSNIIQLYLYSIIWN